MTHRILRIDASARAQGSVTRDLTGRITARWPAANLLHRDLAADPLPHLTEDWVSANFTPHANRTAAQIKALALSDSLIDELRAADTLVIGLPVYNFGVPSALKAWIDHIARAGVTFRYTEDGPVGLLTGKRAILAMASGGTPADAEIDFASPYMRHILGFMGITDVTLVAADRMALDADASLEKAHGQIAALHRAA